MALGYSVSLQEPEVRDIVEKWRESRPLTVRLWHELDRACKAAVDHPGKVFSYRGVKFALRGKNGGCWRFGCHPAGVSGM